MIQQEVITNIYSLSGTCIYYFVIKHSKKSLAIEQEIINYLLFFNCFKYIKYYFKAKLVAFISIVPLINYCTSRHLCLYFNLLVWMFKAFCWKFGDLAIILTIFNDIKYFTVA